MSIQASKTARKAILVLADGTVFYGRAMGADGQAVGEIVFNTAMTGYQEILTDPSYAEQIISFTYPHIGNYGVNEEDAESDKIWAKALVIREASLVASNFRQQQTLADYLIAQGVVAICDVDTRRLTHHIREHGGQKACVMSYAATAEAPIEQALQAIQNHTGCDASQLVAQVTCAAPYEWQQGPWVLGEGFQTPSSSSFHVVAYDFGVKKNFLRMLIERGCRVTVVPAHTPADEVLALQPDGIFLSNGPGVPAADSAAIQAVKVFLAENIPLFGVCFGYQLLALAAGAQTVKMKVGHHGVNHPVLDHARGIALITRQNHRYAVTAESLPECFEITHTSLFDGSLQGVQHKEKPAFGFQGHPAASPGSRDAVSLFDHFIDLLQQHSSTSAHR